MRNLKGCWTSPMPERRKAFNMLSSAPGPMSLRFERDEQISGMHREAHWVRSKSILKYLKRTKDIFLIYSGGDLILEGYNDASFQSDDDDAKSQSGFVFKLNGGVVA
ncbi:UNVERIFIED_CONTAM: hypothetical protein Sradi_3843500 [Sesamum radiatum]|uniref:Uncharacterized protein n=1 Tax=Sesamum radiatum TaxID=300843 RepID=A0AAW2Q1U2_SESRA